MPEIELRLLRYFRAVYTARSFTQAAKELSMAQPPLSQAITGLERTLETILFRRSTREVVPTPAGHRLYEEAESILRRAEQLPRLVQESEQHPLRPVRVGAMSSVFSVLLPRLLPHLSDYQVLVTDMPSEQQAQALDRGDLDLAILRAWKDPRHEQVSIMDERLIVALPEGHPLAECEAVGLRELRGERIVFFDRSRARVAFDAIAAAFSAAGVSPRPAAHVTSEQAMLGLVAAGQGFALVNELMALSPWPGVRFLPLESSRQRTPLRARVQPGDPLGLLPVIRRARDAVVPTLNLPS